MRQIYSGASSVIVWLGESEKHAVTAIRFAQMLLSMFKENCGVEKIIGHSGLNVSEEQLHSLMTAYPIIDNEQQVTDRDVLEALIHLFSRPWFRRIWVLQEVGSGKGLEGELVLCGAMSVPWEGLVLAEIWQSGRRQAWLRAGFQHHPLRTTGILPSVWIRLGNAGKEGRLPLIDLLLESRAFNATDPRDKIFALLGLMEPKPVVETLSSAIIPSYNKPMPQVFVEITRYLVAQQQSLDILSASIPDVTDEHRDLPRWTPDFRKTMDPWQVIAYQCDYHATAHTLPRIGTAKSWDALELEGLVFDTVTQVATDIILSDMVDDSLDLGESLYIIYSMLVNISSEDTKYPTGE